MKPWKKIVIIAATLIGILFAASFFYVSYSADFMKTAAQNIEKIIDKKIQTKVKIDAVQINSLTSVKASGITVYDKNEKILAQAQDVIVDFSPLAIIKNTDIISGITTIAVDNPIANIEKRPDGTWNYNDILSNTSESNNFTGNIDLHNGTANVSVQNKQMKFAKINGKIAMKNPQQPVIKATLYQDKDVFDISGIIGDKFNTVTIKSPQVNIDKYLPFIPQNILPAELQLIKGSIKDMNLKIALPLNKTPIISGQMTLENGACSYQAIQVKNINGLFIFKDDYLTAFANARVQGQLLKMHGKITLTDNPELSVVAESDKFNPKTILKNIPFTGDVAFTADITGKLSAPKVKAYLSAKQADAYGFSIADAKVEGSFADDTIYIDRASANIAAGQIEAKGIFHVKNQSYEATADFKNLQCSEFKQFLPGISGLLSGNITATGDIEHVDDVKFYAAVKLKNALYKNILINNADAAIAKDGQNIKIAALTADMGQGGKIAAAGNINNNNLNIEVSGTKINLQTFEKYAQVPMTGEAGFHGFVTGDINNPHLQLQLGANDGTIMAQPYHLLLLAADGTIDNIKINKFEIKNSRNETVHTASGSVGLTGRRSINLVVDTKNARMENIAAAFMPGHLITGAVDNKLILTGTLDNIQANGHIFFHEGNFQGILLTNAQGDYAYKDRKIILHDFSIKTPFATALISGAVNNNDRLDFLVKIKNIDIAKLPIDFPYPVSGSADFDGRLTGTVSNPIFTSTIASKQVVFNNVQLNNIAGNFDYQNGVANLSQIQCEQGTGKILLNGKLNLLQQSLQGNLNAVDLDVKALTAIANLNNNYITGKFNGKVDLTGSLSNPAIHFNGSVQEGYVKNHPLQQMTIDISYINNILKVNNFYGQQDNAKIAAQGSWDTKGKVDLVISAQGVDADVVADVLNYDVAAKGTLDIYSQITGTAKNPQANISFEIDGGGIGTATFDRMTGLLNLKDGNINVEQILVNKGVYKASATGKIPLIALKAKPWEMLTRYDQIDLKLSLDNADLSILPFLSKQIAWANGPLQGNVQITGTLAHPLFNGFIKLNNGLVKLKELKAPIENMQADIVFNQEKMQINQFSGNIGRGTYNLNGNTLITGGGLRKYNFILSMDKLDIYSPFYKGALTADFKLTEDKLFGKVLPKLTGNLPIQNAEISLPTIPDNNMSILPDMILDVGIDVGKKVIFASSGLYNMDIVGNVHFGGTTRFVLPSGQITAERGTISYLKTIFKIREGTAAFNQVGKFLPSIVFKADTTLAQTKVYLSVEGPVDAMDFNLQSEPAMNQEEIIKLLTFRTAYRQGDTVGSNDLASLAAIGFQMNFFNEMENFMRDTLRLDEFNIVRDSISSNKNDQQQNNYDEVYNIEIGKNISDKTMLKYTNSINYDDYKFGIQYDFNNNVSLLNEWDKRNGYQVTLEANFKF